MKLQQTVNAHHIHSSLHSPTAPGIKYEGIKYEVIEVKGFSAAGIHSGVKRKKKDLGIVLSDRPCTAAGVFTTNVTKAAPVVLSQQHIAQQQIAQQSGILLTQGLRALLVNSGNANACTGGQGMVDAKAMVAFSGDAFGIPCESVLLASTGIIGVPLDMPKITSGIQRLPSAMSKDLLPFGHAMMTTDTYLKIASTHIEIAGHTYALMGLAKGSGMIHPNMATMLGFLFTDAPVAQTYLQDCLSEATAGTFNMVSVDGDTSTNDMVLLMANGAGGGEVIDGTGAEDWRFKAAVQAVCESLAIQIAKDGEGATKTLEVQLSGGESLVAARQAARAVVSSSLVKAAFFGQDANWGRIACALGYSGASFSPDKLSIGLSSRLGHIQLLNSGTPLAFEEDEAFDVLRGEHITIHIDLKAGAYQAKAWGCDLSYDYVKINGAYRT